MALVFPGLNWLWIDDLLVYVLFVSLCNRYQYFKYIFTLYISLCSAEGLVYWISDRSLKEIGNFMFSWIWNVWNILNLKWNCKSYGTYTFCYLFFFLWTDCITLVDELFIDILCWTLHVWEKVICIQIITFLVFLFFYYLFIRYEEDGIQDASMARKVFLLLRL